MNPYLLLLLAVLTLAFWAMTNYRFKECKWWMILLTVALLFAMITVAHYLVGK